MVGFIINTINSPFPILTIVFAIVILAIEMLITRIFGLKYACLTMGIFNIIFIFSFFYSYINIFMLALPWIFLGITLSVLSDIILLYLFVKKKCKASIFVWGVILNTLYIFLAYNFLAI